MKIVARRRGALPADEVGEVRLQVPGRPREYYNDPEATAETWRDGWLVTGDLGKLDADGYLYIVGRSKDVIIRGGNNVHATDVEHVLVQHDDVKEVAVVGAPHPVLGEDVVAFVVLHPDSTVTPDDCVPSVSTTWPTTRCRASSSSSTRCRAIPTGKVVKNELRARLAAAPA